MTTAQERMRKRRSGWETCAAAASEMRTILDELEEYPGLYGEAAELRKRLDCMEAACGGAEPEPDPVEEGGDPRTVARELVARLPLEAVFQDPALSDAFLSELLLALARASSGRSRRERQREGIEQAKAQGVRFGAPKHPLPENFDEVRREWREGRFNLTEAAGRCGMAKTTFYNAVQRAEQREQAHSREEARAVPAKRRARPAPARVL